MKTTPKFRVAGWLLLLFASGIVLGNVAPPRKAPATPWWLKSEAAPETHWVENRKQDFAERYKLTSEQLESLAPAFNEAESQLRQVRELAAKRTRMIVVKNNQAIKEVMTVEQRKEFEDWQLQYRNRNQSTDNQ